MIRAAATWIVVYALVLVVLGMVGRVGTIELVLAFLASIGLTALLLRLWPRPASEHDQIDS